MPRAIILVPLEGDHAALFKIVADTLNAKVYGKDAMIVGVKVVPIAGGHKTTLSRLGGAKFSGNAKGSVGTVMTISHGGPLDGPIMKQSLKEHLQPWGANKDKTALNAEAVRFWRKTGTTVVPGSGKIILMGCNMGAYDYARFVASAAGATVYAANNSIAAADNETVLKQVRAIEAGKAISPMLKFSA